MPIYFSICRGVGFSKFNFSLGTSFLKISSVFTPAQQPDNNKHNINGTAIIQALFKSICFIFSMVHN